MIYELIFQIEKVTEYSSVSWYGCESWTIKKAEY